MNIALIKRYRKHVEYSIWLLIGSIALFVNLVTIPTVQNNLETLNIVITAGVIYTVLYYRVIAPRYENQYIILSSIVTYTLFVLTIIHLTGSLQSILFALIFIPTLISALLIGIKAMITVVSIQSLWLFWEYFVVIQPETTFSIEASQLLWERVLGVLLVAFVSYNNSKEIFTRQYEHEQLITEKENLYQLQQREDIVLSSISEMVVALSNTGRILFANDSFYTSFHLNPADTTDKPISNFLRANEVDQLGAKITERNKHSEGPLTIALLNKIKDTPNSFTIKSEGAELYVRITTSPLKSHQGKTKSTGVVVIMKNITEEKQLEMMKLDFVSMAAHELRTPITAIRGYLDALKTEAWTRLKPEEKKFVSRADISALQLATLMENLLSVSKIEKGNYTLHTQPTDWVAHIKKQLVEFRLRAKERDLTIVFKNPPKDLPLVAVDPLRITEVFTNLVSNAINYTDTGKITVTLEYDPHKNHVVTHISDTGQGIPEESLDHLFQKFFRVSGVLEQGSKGTGLGLYISKQIVELHRGSIWVESKLGKGSTFSFSLPAANNTPQKNQNDT
jgi:signal transduction histidine kinase